MARPNVIFILTDDQGYGDLSYTGNPVLRTPALDRLQTESARFTDFHVCPVCTPTRGRGLTPTSSPTSALPRPTAAPGTCTPRTPAPTASPSAAGRRSQASASPHRHRRLRVWTAAAGRQRAAGGLRVAARRRRRADPSGAGRSDRGDLPPTLGTRPGADPELVDRRRRQPPGRRLLPHRRAAHLIRSRSAGRDIRSPPAGVPRALGVSRGRGQPHVQGWHGRPDRGGP